MEYGFFEILNLIGSLCLFLFGMKIMSESLQKVAGDKMRSILTAMTSNRFMGVLTGFLVTMIIQSSSATTVMVVSFVNAGLLSLTQSIGVIMGANIGTTFTAWLISLLGFKLSIAQLAVPLIGIGTPLVFSRRSSLKSWGEFIIGFAILFLGLDFLKNSVPQIDQHPDLMQFLSDYANMGYGSVLLFLGIGTVLTLVLQSSSATMALTLVMCSQGWISFDLAAAMVLGENIGTTITANLAAAVGNVSAKRAARAHFIFNVIGAMWMLIVFYPFLQGINHVMVKFTGGSPYQSPASIPIALSIFHTSFNLINTGLLVWFIPFIEKIVSLMVPSKKDEDEEFRLVHISTGMLSTAELSILQANKEIIIYAKRVYKMFGFVKKLSDETNDRDFNKLYDRIEKYENISDRIEIEIATYLNKVSAYELSPESTRKLQAMFREISEIESIADSCCNLARTMKRKRELKIWFNQELRNNMSKMYDLLDDAFDLMNANLESSQKKHAGVVLAPSYEVERRINKYRDKLKEEHLRNVEVNKYKYQAGVIYSDLFSEAEQMGDYIINVSEAISSVDNPVVAKYSVD